MKFIILIFLGAVLLFNTPVESSSLIKSPWNDDLGSLLSMIFSCESSIKNLKYDRKSEEWVETCPDVECEHGTDEGDQDTCPSCLLGPGDGCSDWIGKCGENMECRYSSAFESIGTCVSESEFNSRKEGESCGHYEGKCGEGLKCQKDSNILSLFCGMDEAGVCITNEQFSSRGEGESCGETSGKCREGLECVESNFGWFSFVCKNTTNNETSENDNFGDGIFFEEIIEDSLSEDGEPEEHVHIKVVDNNNGDESNRAIEEILKSQIDSLIGSDLKEEKQIMDEIHQSQVEGASSAITHINHRTKVGDTEEIFTIDIEKNPDVKEESADVTSDITVDDPELSDTGSDFEEKTMQTAFEVEQPSIELL